VSAKEAADLPRPRPGAAFPPAAITRRVPRPPTDWPPTP